MQKQVFLTVTGSKKLIGEALAERKDIQDAALHHTAAIIMGTTNAYFAESLCRKLNLGNFHKEGFFRGILKPAEAKLTAPIQKYDLVIKKGEILKNKDIYAVADQLCQDDMIFKGANAVNLEEKLCAVLIMNPAYGTMDPISRAHFGRRAKLIHPVGLEKRITGSLYETARIVNSAETGLRLSVSDGMPYTEIDAFQDLFHVNARMIAAGGSGGYEGGCMFLLDGEEENVKRAVSFAEDCSRIPPYQL